MRTSEREQDGGGVSFGRGRGRLLAIGAASVAMVGAAAVVGACSLIVDTNANQCVGANDCSSFAGFRACNMGVCQANLTVPACKMDSDCTSFAQATCNTASGFCTRPCMSDTDCGISGVTCGSNGMCGGGTMGDGGMGCTMNAECSATMGQDFICRNSKCVTYTLTVAGQSLCTTLYASKTPASAAYQDDTAVIIGDILPTAANADGPYGHLVEDSIKLALDDIGKADGIPGLTGANRPLVLVGCNDGVNEDQTDVVAKHLINDLAVPAIIGYAFSGSTISVAQDVTIPDNVLLFSPSATAVAITTLETNAKTNPNDLLWRDCPNDNVQAQAQLLLFPSVQTAVTGKYPMVDSTHLKVAVVHHKDAYGSGLASTVEGGNMPLFSGLSFNGKMATDPANNGCAADSGTGGPSDATACFFDINYGPSTNPDVNAIPVITDFQPDIIFLFGFNEAVDTIFKQVEAQWTVPADGHKPFWILSDGDQVSSLWATHPDATNPTQMDPADISTEDQRERVIGSVPGTNANSWTPYGQFLSEFAGSSYGIADGSADTIGPAGAYDITFLLAFSTVMVGKNPLTGPNLVKLGLQKMQKTAGLPVIQISQQTSDILGAFSMLTGDTPVNVQGVSGPLLFNGKGDLTTADIQIWCVPPGTGMPDVGTAAINSGYYFDAQTTKLAGCISKTCNLPNYAGLQCP
jgi:hypothetical protein